MSATPLYDRALTDFHKKPHSMLLWQALVKQLELENTKVKAEHAAYVEGSEEAFAAVVQQKQDLEKRIEGLQLSLRTHQDVVARQRNQLIKAGIAP
jgi:hypothetical protein